MKKIKISQLPLYNSLEGLSTIGTDADNRSVRVELSFIVQAFKEVVAEAKAAAEAAQSVADDTSAAISGKVDKVEGKGLSANDFTDALKAKLEGLSNYDDAEVRSLITAINGRLDTILGDGASSAIDTFNEIEAFLTGITDTQTLTGLLAEQKQTITSETDAKLAGKVDKVSGKGLSANDYTDEDKAKLAELGALLSYPEDVFSYGVEFDTSISSPSCTRVGNVALHKTLPIQSRMRGCLLDDDGQVVEYLDPRDWTGQFRDGSRGQVMVEIPMHYRKFETNGTKRVVRLSEYPISGYHQVPQMYVSAYEASIERSTGKLCSVVNDSADYRGGNNNANYDGTYRSFLGRPVTSIDRVAFRSAARKRKSGSSEWNCYTYDVHKALFWLFTVEYAQLNSQAAYNSELTSEGFRQGGLGVGVSEWSYSEWQTFNGAYPFVPCGHTDSLGNRTGVVSYTAKNDDESISKTFDVPRYRGVENPFGHIWKWTDGINVRISPTEENGGDGLSKVFVCKDPAKFKDNGYDGYSHVGNEARTDGYVKEIIGGEYGEIMPSLVGGGSTQFFCDYHWTNIPTTEALRGVMFGGYAVYDAFDGLAYAFSVYAPTDTNTSIGSRLCFLPAN